MKPELTFSADCSAELGAAKSLNALVATYVKHIRPLRNAEFAWWGCGSLESVINRAASSITRTGAMHMHQRRIGHRRLGVLKNNLLELIEEIESCDTFSGLIGIVSRFSEYRSPQKINRLGELTAYDVALRIGAWEEFDPDLAPMVVYVHSGTRDGLSLLRPDLKKCTQVSISELPIELSVLTPREAEDFLCVCKDQLAKLSGD